MPDRLPKPWRVREAAESVVVEDATGYPVAYLYFQDPPNPTSKQQRLSKKQALAVARKIAEIGK